MNQGNATFTQRTGNKLVSLPAQSSPNQQSRSFVAVLLKALSAVAN
jgi:hypothetical protein